MKIYIPSRGRARIHHQFTLMQLTAEDRARTALVVRFDEVDAYRPVALHYGTHLIIRPPYCDNLSKTLEWIVWEESTDEQIILADDDIRFSFRKDPTRSNQAKATPEEVHGVIVRIESLLNKGYPLAGIVARMGCNSNGLKLIRYGIRQMQFHALRPAFFKEHDIHYSDVTVKSDFHTTLSVLETGNFNAVITNASVDQAKGSNAPGGVSSYRTVEAMNAGAKRLKELHPRAVDIVKKTTDWKGIGNVTRDEVRISWKTATAKCRHPDGVA